MGTNCTRSILLVSENCTRDHLFKLHSKSCDYLHKMLHLKCSGKSYRSPCNFENAQVALRWPNRYTFYSNAFLKHFYRSKSTLDRLKVFSMYLRGNRRWLFLRLWLKNCTQLSKLQEVIMRSPMSMFTPRDKYENLCLVRPSLRLHFPAQFFFFFFFLQPCGKIR